MTSWADRAKTHFSQKRQEPTAETAKSRVSAVLAVPYGAVCENSKVLSAVLAVPSRHISEKHAFSELAANDGQAPDPDRHCYPHTEACNSVELALMATRLERFARIGLPVDQAEKLADRLKDRDRDPQDDRRLCLECQHCQYGRCSNSRAAGLNHPELAQDYALLLKRCNGFALGQGTMAYSVTTTVTARQPQHGHPLTAQPSGRPNDEAWQAMANGDLGDL